MIQKAARLSEACAIVCCLSPSIGLAETPTDAMAAASAPQDQFEQIYVWGKREDALGQAATSSEGTVSFATFEDRPILRPGEVAEVIPGLAVTQHSGAGKANQYFMRGFNLDHGTDFSVSLDGVPLNLRSHGHGQGYLDLNILTPELIETIHYRKGTYFADIGDFSAAGSAAFVSFQSPPPSFAEAWIGENNYYRLVGLQAVGNASYLALDLTANDGPWVLPEHLRRATMHGRFGIGPWALSIVAYANKWDSTDQVPVRAVESGLLSRFGVIDPSDGGKTSRLIVSARNRDLDGWEAIVYVQKYKLNLWSNFTYFLDDPVRGDQFEQVDDRWIAGASLTKVWDEAIGGWTISAGGEARDDIIDEVALYHTQNRTRLGTVRADDFNQYSAALWAAAGRAFGPLRLTLGTRVDANSATVSADNPANSGSASDAIVSPKATMAWLVSNALELYAAAGRGFHSNDARGATETIAPKTGMAVDPVSLIAPAWGAEVGARWQADGLTATATVFYLHLASELVYSGDAGDTESTSASERLGTEILFNWRPVPRLNFDVAAAATHARYLGHPEGGNHIPNAIDYMLTAGVSALISDDLTITVTMRRLGPAPLIEDASVKSRPATLANFLLRYRLGDMMFTGEVLNVFNNRANDIQYYYASRLPGESALGVDDFHIHPAEPRTLRAGIRLTY